MFGCCFLIFLKIAEGDVTLAVVVRHIVGTAMFFDLYHFRVYERHGWNEHQTDSQRQHAVERH